MKRFFITSFFVLTVSSVLWSSNFKFGLMIGANSSVNSFDTSSFFNGYDSKLGFNANLFSRIKVGKFYFQPELGYYNNRTEVKFFSNGQPVNASLSLGNIYGTTLLGFKFSKLRFNAGPMFYKTTSSTFDEEIKELTIEKLSENLLLGGQVGVGFDISKKWFLDLRFQKMFSNSELDFSEGGQPRQVSGQYGNLSFSIGYSILNLGK